MAIETKPRRLATALLAALAMLTAPVAASAQVVAVDPDAAIDGDLNGESTAYPAPTASYPQSEYPQSEYPASTSQGNGTPVEPAPAPSQAVPPPVSSDVDTWSTDSVAAAAEAQENTSPTTYRKDDLIGAAEGVFGKGAEGLAEMIEDLLKKQGEPNAYIVGREGSGAIGIGVRYGSGTLYHRVEGNRPVYWTGPSLGFDLGLNAGKAFVLVYNLYDTQSLYKRFPAGEGQAYLVGGFNVSYMRRGDVVLIPVRMGAGVRLGVNAGYMKFTEEQNWLPF